MLLRASGGCAACLLQHRLRWICFAAATSHRWSTSLNQLASFVAVVNVAAAAAADTLVVTFDQRRVRVGRQRCRRARGGRSRVARRAVAIRPFAVEIYLGRLDGGTYGPRGLFLMLVSIVAAGRREERRPVDQDRLDRFAHRRAQR